LPVFRNPLAKAWGFFIARFLLKGQSDRFRSFTEKVHSGVINVSVSLDKEYQLVFGLLGFFKICVSCAGM